MSKIFNSTTILILGIILLLLGGYQNSLYESSIKVDATIVDVVVKEEYDSDMIYSHDSYTVYADYIVNGKEYTHVKVGKYSSPKDVGDTIQVVVNPENPDGTVPDGGIFIVIGIIATVGAAVCKIKSRKHSK